MEIQVKSPPSASSRRSQPFRNPIALVRKGELTLFHSDCGGRISIEQDDPADFDAYATVRCNLCFDTYREKQSSISRDLNRVIGKGIESSECTVLSFVPLSRKELFTHSPLAARLQHFFRGSRRH